MAAPTWNELRDGALNAIKHIQESGKSVSYQGRSLTMADIPDLMKLVDMYDQKIAAAAGKATRSRVSYVTPVI